MQSDMPRPLATPLASTRGFTTSNNLRTFVWLALLTALMAGTGFLFRGVGGAVIGLALAFVLNFTSYWFSDKIALAMSGAQPVTAAEAPELYDMVSTLSQRAGLPMPRVYITPDMAPNAFATGRNPQHAAVAVTEGILHLLNQDELEGVLAHELAHVQHRDILISSIAAMLAGAITHIATMMQWSMMFAGSSDDERENPLGLVGALAAMILAPIGAMVIQALVSQSREFEADRGGAEICGRPLSLAHALLKLERGVMATPMHVNPASAHMYIMNPFAGLNVHRWFSTHPSTAERVARLEAMAREGTW